MHGLSCSGDVGRTGLLRRLVQCSRSVESCIGRTGRHRAACNQGIAIGFERSIIKTKGI
jgi:hypothetical protein